MNDRDELVEATLYVVATPIGNLEDITLRAIRVLKGCDLIAAEDTRRTGLLIKHLGIEKKPLLSYHQFNEARRTQELVPRLQSGESIALVTDGGTPCVSDPGGRLIQAVRAAGLRVEAVPGPSAVITALSTAAMNSEVFHFYGFLPHKSGQRRKQLESVQDLPGTLVFYESPFRVNKLLKELVAVFPDRHVVIARELTKKFEELIEGTAPEILEKYGERGWKGECVVLIAGATGGKSSG